MKEAYWAKELANLKLIQARDKRDETRAVVANHGEVLGGVWLAMNKDRKLRDIIPCLKIPNPQNNPNIKFEQDSMVQCAKRPLLLNSSGIAWRKKNRILDVGLVHVQ